MSTTSFKPKNAKKNKLLMFVSIKIRTKKWDVMREDTLEGACLNPWPALQKSADKTSMPDGSGSFSIPIDYRNNISIKQAQSKQIPHTYSILYM